jgi:alpha-mannosidase
MLFPTALDKASGTYEIPFGAITRDLNRGEEVPSQRFADVSGEAAFSKSAGVLVLNDSKYGHSLQGSTLAVTLIRSSYEPDILPEIGEHDVRLAILPHEGAMPRADMIRHGAAFNRPLQVVGTGVHAGQLAASSPGLSAVEPGNVVVSGVKKAEAGDELIVRLYETEGVKSTASVEFDQAIFGKVENVREADLLERPLDKGTARVKGNGLTVDLPPRGIVTVQIGFR